MITQKIRILNNQSTTCLFRLWTTFSGMELYTYSILPAWIVPSSSLGYIDYLTLTPTVTGIFTYDFTLGGSPSQIDARLIIEVVESLTEELNTCSKTIIYESFSITNYNGNVKVSVSSDWSEQPLIGDYVYISGGDYDDYVLVIDSIPNSTLVLDLPFITFNPVLTYFVTVFDKSTTCITWITREGGRASYMFDQRKDFSVLLTEGKTFDNNRELKYFDRGKSFDGKTVYKTGLSDNEIDLLSSLRQSIQAWEHNLVTNVSTPILIDSKSFDLYSTKSRLNEVQLQYRLAGYQIVQSQ